MQKRIAYLVISPEWIEYVIRECNAPLSLAKLLDIYRQRIQLRNPYFEERLICDPMGLSLQ